MNYPNLKLELISVDSSVNDVKTTIGYCNPNASDEILKEFGMKLNALTTNTFKAIRKVATDELSNSDESYFSYTLGNRTLTFAELESAWAKGYIDNNGITGLDTSTTIAVGAANIGGSTTLIFSDGTNSRTKVANSAGTAISIMEDSDSLEVSYGDFALILADSDKQAAFARCLNGKNGAYNYAWDSNNFTIMNKASETISFSIDLSNASVLGKLLYDTYKTDTPSGLTVTESGGFYSFSIESTGV